MIMHVKFLGTSMYMGLQIWSNYLITDYAHRNSDKTHIVMQIVSFPNAWWSWGGGGDGHLSWIMLLVGSDFFMLEATLLGRSWTVSGAKEVAGPGGSQGYGHGLGLRWVWGSTVGGRGNGKQILNWLYRACIALLRGPAWIGCLVSPVWCHPGSGGTSTLSPGKTTHSILS